MGNTNLNDWYVEYAIGTVANRMFICNLQDFPTVIKENQGSEIYRSMFLYDESVEKYVEKAETISGFNGLKYIDKIVLDIDLKGEAHGNEAIQDVLRLIEKLNTKGIPDEIVNVWFSGRGFHIHIPNVYKFEPSENIDKVVRASIQRDFGEYVDIIYDATRLIRTGYSYNLKTGCYKNPLRIDELKSWDYDTIKEISKEIRQDYAHSKLKYNGEQILVHMDISRKNIKEHRKVFENAKTETSRIITCIQHLYNAGEVEGSRHKHLLRLISVWMSKFGADTPMIRGLVQAYVSKFQNKLPLAEVDKMIVDAQKIGGYRYGCTDPILSQYCDPKCNLYKYKNLEENTEVLDAGEMVDLMVDYVNTDFSLKSFDLQTVFPFLPEPHLFKAGDLAILAGDTKLGKTAFYQYIVTKTPEIKTLFMSLEVDKPTIIRRFMQQMLQKDKQTILNLLAQGDTHTINTLKNLMSHIVLLNESPDITKYADLIQQYKPKMVVIDTIDMIPARYAKEDEYERMDYIVKELKKLSMQEDIILLGVSHISKGASRKLKEGIPMDIHDTKVNSVIEHKADKIISFEGDRDNSRIRRIRTLGSRDESTFHIVCNFDWTTFSFKQRN